MSDSSKSVFANYYPIFCIFRVDFTYIQNLIAEKEKEKAEEIRVLNEKYNKELNGKDDKYRSEIDMLKENHSLVIENLKEDFMNSNQELSNKLVAVETELKLLKESSYLREEDRK